MEGDKQATDVKLWCCRVVTGLSQMTKWDLFPCLEPTQILHLLIHLCTYCTSSVCLATNICQRLAECLFLSLIIWETAWRANFKFMSALLTERVEGWRTFGLGWSNPSCPTKVAFMDLQDMHWTVLSSADELSKIPIDTLTFHYCFQARVISSTDGN